MAKKKNGEAQQDLAGDEIPFGEDPACAKKIGAAGECILRANHDGKCAETEYPHGDQKRKRVEMELLVDLTADEVVERAKKFKATLEAIASHETHSKMVKDDLKSKESRLEDERNRIGFAIGERKELRAVPVDQVVDFPSNSYFEERLDTKEEIPGSRRSLSLDERQRELGLKLTPEQKKTSDFTKPMEDDADDADPVDAAIQSELGAPTNSGRASRGDGV